MAEKLTVKKLIDTLSLNILVEGDFEREITDGYVGDLLSWVMGRAGADSAWVTVMGNINAIAVASLADVSCIILSENAHLDENAKDRAEIQGITVLSSDQNAYQLALKIGGLLKP